MDKIKLFLLFLKGDWKTSVPGAVILIATFMYSFDFIDATKFGVICAMASGIIGLVAADAKKNGKKIEPEKEEKVYPVEDKGNINDY